MRCVSMSNEMLRGVSSAGSMRGKRHKVKLKKNLYKKLLEQAAHQGGQAAEGETSS